MKRFMKKTVVWLLTVLMMFEACDTCIAYAANEIGDAIDPTRNFVLDVPEKYRDGGNWFFIAQSDWAASEKSNEPMYIPIQRTGDTDSEADITLKVIDLSAKHDVNYKVEILKDKTEPSIAYADMSLKELAMNEDAEFTEVEPTDENGLGEAISEIGGADIVDGSGTVIGSVTATPLDENGNPKVTGNEDDEESAAPAENEASAKSEASLEGRLEKQGKGDQTQNEADEDATSDDAEADKANMSPTERLRAARSAFTGKTSDRQELEGGDLSDLAKQVGGKTLSDDEFNKEMADATQDGYPGREYRLHFSAGEDVKYLKVTPLYSELAEGDAQLMLMLKDPSDNFGIGEDTNPVAITIFDEDEPEPVTVSMAADTVIAEKGKAAITVTREGRLNVIKGVTVSSWDGTAKQGDEYSGIGAKLYFPMGIKSRTIEIPVYHGTEEKDFNVTITALDDENIETATTRVVIPAAPKKTEGELMALTELDGRPFTDPINIKAGWFSGGAGGGFDNDTQAHLFTRIDKEETTYFWLPTSGSGYAYDGMFVEYKGFLDWCDGEFRLSRWNPGGYNMNHDYFDDGGIKDDQWLGGYWGDKCAPEKVSIEVANVDNEGAVWDDSYAAMWINSVRFIKRKFNIYVEPAEVKPLIGMTDKQVLNDYEAVMLDNSTYSYRSLWTEDSFALTAKDTKSHLRLVGIEAKVRDNTKEAWYRIATIDGKSDTAVVKMTQDRINAMAAKGCIQWDKNGSGRGGDSWQGTITVRPVFDYINATVELKKGDQDYGALHLEAPTPSMLWDFNSDRKMDDVMGVDSFYATRRVSWTGEKEGNDEYYTFTATGGDPYVPVITHAESVENIRYIKVRARNLSAVKNIELFASINNETFTGNRHIEIPLEKDTGWHEYVVDIKNSPCYVDGAWNGKISYFRLDPMAGSEKNGSQIQIDYMAFFPDENSAKAFRDGDNGAYRTGTYTYHLGDKVRFTTEINGAGTSANVEPDGIYYELRKSNKNGELINFNDVHYINGGIPFQLTDKAVSSDTVDHPYYSFKPTFTEKGNRITVIVPDEYYNKYIDTTKGLFADGNFVSVSHTDGAYYYVIAEDILTNDIYELNAYTKNSENVIPKWILSDGSEYFGNAMYIRSNPRAKDNAITLTAAAGSHLTYATLSGTIVSSTMNLASGRSTTDLNSASGAVVSFGVTGAVTNEDGKFTTPAFLYDSDAKIRYLVSYNGVTTIQEAKVPSNRAAKQSTNSVTGKQVQAVNADAGIVRVDTYSETGAHFASAIANQRGQLQGALHALTLNGKELRVLVKVDKGGEYTVGNKTYTENIKDVTLYFQDQETGEIHGRFSSNTEPASGSPAKWSYDDETGEFWLIINSFDPAHPTLWTYGDVLMAQLTTDKKTALSGMDDNAAVKDMVYDAVSTGYGVYADPNYQPMVLNFEPEDIAGILGVQPKTDEDGNLLDDDTRYSFGAFPYIGQITAAVGVVSKVVATVTKSEDAEAMLEDLKNAPDPASIDTDDEDAFDDAAGDLGNDAGQKSSTYAFLFSLFFEVQETPYGGVRFMLGVIVSIGGGRGYSRQKNPYQNKKGLAGKFKEPVSTDTYTIGAGGSSINEKTGEVTKVGGNIINDALIHGQSGYKGTSGNGYSISEYGGPYFKITAYIGVYLDYGYIEISKNGGAEKSHDMVYMGAGGFIGFSGTVGYTWAFMLVVIPAYVNVEAGIGVTFFLGSSADPNKTLDSFKNSKELKGQDFGFYFEIKGNAYVSGTIGVGFYKIVGIRITVSLGFELGYSPNITKWYPDLFDSNFGYVSEVTFTGTIDLFITSIDIYSASWPLPLADGFMYYFQEARRGNLCISYVENGIKSGKGKGKFTDAEEATARAMMKELADIIDSDKASTETIMEKTKALKNYAYDHNMLSWVAKCRIEMNKQGGIAGTIVNASLQDDTDESGIHFHTNDHVDSKWVANNGELTAAFSAVESTALVENAIAQPSSKIVNLGNGKFLMTFLDDTASRDDMQASTLKWTVFDGSKWSKPVTVQNDNTADGKPNLVDAGDKVILSWSSMTDAKYEALKEAVRAELTDAGKSDSDVDVLEALEKDPARVLAQMDIFSAEFDKALGTFGEITQLTDDEFYDDNPLAVYDTKTNDYIVMYYKTAQDDKEYATAGDKLLDVIGASADPEKSYSVIAYMLYNGTKETGDPFDVGWVTTGLYDNEIPDDWTKTGEEFVEEYGPERYLPSTITYDNGEYADPPIYDLTAAQGYNGLAAFAYTVDKDFDLKTAEDRELYTQFYEFETHSTYVPVCVAGEVTYEAEKYNSETEQFETRQYTDQVEVGAPKLVRNGGNTYLFWRENGKNLKYLNISQMLNKRVAAVAEPGDNPNDWQYALRDDGTFATDAVTGIKYEPDAKYVDFGSLMTASDIEITDYEIISDEDDNLYVVWTDSVTHNVTDEAGRTYPVVSQPIYATAMIHQDERDVTYKDENGEDKTRKDSTVSWSKPYRLTRDESFNDGLALTLDDDGNLMIVHNQYTKETAESEEEVLELVKEGKIGLTYDKEGKAYAPTLSYNSPVNLMVTKCEKIGSLEATAFEYSDYNPAGGQTIKVKATLENVGLTDAEGSKVEFYEYKDGVRGKKIYSFTSEDHIQVNTAKAVTFNWTVPKDGVDGYQIEAVIQEKNSGGGYYPAVTSYSDAFKQEAQLALKINDCQQEGDKFRVDYSVINAGNAPVSEGTKVGLNLVGLYGDLDSDRYGNIEDGSLYSTDLILDSKTAESDTMYISTEDGAKERKASTIHTAEFNESVLLDIPSSLFKFCGYDALQLVTLDEKGNVLQESDQTFVALAEPMNLKLNGGNAVNISGDEAKQVGVTFDSTVFIEESKVAYSVEDPTIASVTEDGTVTGIKNGTTKLTATLLPSGKSATVDLAVSGITHDSYIISFNTNGGIGEMDEMAIAAGNKANLTKNAFTRSGYGFTGWNTKADGSGTAYTDGQEITAIEDITLYAQWTELSHGSSSSSSSSSKTYSVTENKIENGDVKTSSTKAKQGDVVTITVTPDDGYEVDKVTIKDAKGNEIKVTKNDDGTYSYTQPSSEVTIDATFKTEESAPTPSKAKFIDVTENDWFYDAVNAVASDGIVFGMTENTFEPQSELTRAMLASMLHRFDGGEASQYQDTFEDVADDKWYSEDISWALENKIISGYDDKTFAPEGNITREQVVTMMYRYTNFKGIDTSVSDDSIIDSYSDSDEISDYARDAFKWARSAGVIRGRSDDILAPRDNITRAEIAQIFVNYKNNVQYVNKISDLAFNFRSLSGWKLDGNNPSGANKFSLLLMK